MIWKEKIEEVDTFEAFYKVFIYNNGTIIFSYINIGISLHPLNPTMEHLFLDKAYIVCTNAYVQKENGIIINESYKIDAAELNKICLGGIDISKDIHCELEVYYKDIFLQTLPQSKIRKEFWVPVDTPYLPANMNTYNLNDFLDQKSLPENLLNIIK